MGLKSKYVTVGIVDKIPVESVHMLLGNDIAGEQVNMCPFLCEKPVVDETCTLSADESQFYPECVVTRAMAKKATRESHSDESDVQGDTDGDTTLSETVYSNWCEPLNVV